MIVTDKLNEDGGKPLPQNMGKYITVFCDGSFCDKTKAWGIGIWIKSGVIPHNKAKTYSYGGVGVFSDNNQVEAHAIHIATTLVKELDTQGKILNIQSDCMTALEQFSECALERTLKLEKCILKHVKAHTGLMNNRSLVNDIVDRLAKKQMRKHRNQV